jgi:hypothetical protein
MSLIATASSWGNDVPPAIHAPKKKLSTIRKQLGHTNNSSRQKSGGIEGFAPLSSQQTHPYKEQSESMSPLYQYENGAADSKRKHIQTLIEKMTSKEENNAGGDLANFKPLNNSNFQVENEFVPKSVPVVSHTSINVPATDGIKYYNPSSTHNLGGNQTNYSNAYQQRIHTPSTLSQSSNNEPYYKKYNIGNHENGSISNEKLMESIKYMIHLLEEQQLEKTNYVMEEFIMYSFLGVFMIYVCDSFSSAGKYIR